MDLKSLISKATSKTEEIVRPVNEVQISSSDLLADLRDKDGLLPSESLNKIDTIIAKVEEVCACGHPEDAHGEGEGDCEILECDCTSFCPPSHSYNINESSSEVSRTPEAIKAPEDSQAQQKSEEVVGGPPPTDMCPCGHELDKQHDKDGFCKIDSCACSRAGAKVTIPSERIPELPAPTDDASKIPDDHCMHLCECGKFWTHGLKMKCRYPDMLKQGSCQGCLKGDTDQIAPEDDFKEGQLSVRALIQAKNDERLTCKNMSIEQITFHIEFYARKIEELRVKSMEARKMRSELEEEELANIPEADREAFLKELRGLKKEKKERKPRTPKAPSAAVQAKTKEAALIAELQTKGKSNAEAKIIAAMMIKSGKTQAQVEVWLND